MPPGALHHIIVRAAGKRKIFLDAADRTNFLDDWKRYSQKPKHVVLHGRTGLRSLFCYWAVQELLHSVTELAEKRNMSQPAVSLCVQRGERIHL